MARRGNCANDLRTVPGDPAKHEERSPLPVTSQELEQRIDALSYSARPGLPLVPCDHGFQRTDLEILLHVNGEEVGRLAHRGGIACETCGNMSARFALQVPPVLLRNESEPGRYLLVPQAQRTRR